VPDQTLFGNGAGEGAEHARALRAIDGTFAMIYLPRGREATINSAFSRAESFVAWWFNPRDGTTVGPLPVPHAAVLYIPAPSTGPTDDWVLVLDDEAAGYGPPGQARR